MINISERIIFLVKLYLGIIKGFYFIIGKLIKKKQIFIRRKCIIIVQLNDI